MPVTDLLDGVDLYAAFEKEVGDWVVDPYPRLAELLAKGPVYQGDALVDDLGSPLIQLSTSELNSAGRS
jgi:hypothetical protein